MQANDIVLNEVERKSKELTRRKKRSCQLEKLRQITKQEEIRSVQQRSIGRHRLRRKRERRTLRDNADHAEAVLL